ncbi:MAG: hypothetical protein HC896_10915 [Bacteroidales bacterium]|nr:hypothetical protein [Bacteroidales bacterium]
MNTQPLLPKLEVADALNTNEIMNDYQFYLKLYLNEVKMDFAFTANDSNNR